MNLKHGTGQQLYALLMQGNSGWNWQIRDPADWVIRRSKGDFETLDACIADAASNGYTRYRVLRPDEPG